MNKKVKMVATVLMLTGSLLSVIPANAATKIDIAKPSGDIAVASVSNYQPENGYSGTLWCTGDGVNVRYADSGRSAYTINKGQSYNFYNVDGNKAYFQHPSSMGGSVKMYVDKRYLSTKYVSKN
ncbi:MAG: hypothetical protein ACLU7E_04875 [Clostridium butyricum]